MMVGSVRVIGYVSQCYASTVPSMQGRALPVTAGRSVRKINVLVHQSPGGGVHIKTVTKYL